MKEFNGHRSWNSWNVYLWVQNDEGLYNLAKECVRGTRDVRSAAKLFMHQVGTKYTPDRGVYTLVAVMNAIRDL